jgi:hypothetical protein
MLYGVHHIVYIYFNFVLALYINKYIYIKKTKIHIN